MMDENCLKGNCWGVWVFFGILLVFLLVFLFCCVGLIFFVVLGSIGIGVFFVGVIGNWWLIGIFVVLVIVMIVLIFSKLLKNKYNFFEGNGKIKNKMDCCMFLESVDWKYEIR